MIFIYNQSDKKLRLDTKETSRGTCLRLGIEDELLRPSPTVITTSNDPEIEAGMKERFGEPMIISSFITRQYIKLLNTRCVFDIKSNYHMPVPHNLTPQERKKYLQYPKNLIVLVLKRGTRFYMNPTDIMGHPSITSFGNKEDNLFMVRFYVKWQDWKNLKKPLLSLLAIKEGNIQIQFGYKIMHQGLESQYVVNSLSVAPYKKAVPVYEKPGSKTSKFKKKPSNGKSNRDGKQPWKKSTNTNYHKKSESSQHRAFTHKPQYPFKISTTKQKSN